MAVLSLAACTSDSQTQPSSLTSSDASTAVLDSESDSSQARSASTIGAVSAHCPGRDPLAAAKSFVTAINTGDQSGYTACVHLDADRGSDSLFQHANWASVARTVNAQLDDQFLRFADTYSFGSPDDPPPSTPTAPQYWIDPNGRLDVTVTLEGDGLYWVTRLSVEFHA